MSNPRAELTKFLNRPGSGDHPALPIAVQFLRKLRTLTGPNGPNELRKREEVGCLVGVAAVLACERLGDRAQPHLTPESARLLSSASKAHFTSALNHCRPLVTAQKSSESPRSTRSSPVTTSSSSAPRMMMNSEEKDNPFVDNIPGSSREQKGEEKRESQTASGIGSTTKKGPAPLGGTRNLDLSGLRRNTNISYSTVQNPPSPNEVGKSSSSQPNVTNATSNPSPASNDPLRTPPKASSASASKKMVGSGTKGSPMHATLMRQRLEESMRSGEENETTGREMEADHGMDVDEIEDNNRISTLNVGPSSTKKSIPKTPPRFISSTIIPTSPYIYIPHASIDPAASYFTTTNHIYPPPISASDRIFGRMIAPEDGSWPNWKKGSGGRINGTKRGREEDEVELARKEREERRWRRRERAMRILVKGFETGREEGEVGAGEGADVTRETGVAAAGRKKKRRSGWDAGFWVPPQTLAENENVADETEDKHAGDGGDEVTLSWQEKMEIYCETFLPEIRAGLNSPTNAIVQPELAQDIVSLEKESWLERANTRGIGARAWMAAGSEGRAD